MKKIFLSVVLLLTVSFAFAANDVEEVSTYHAEETLELVNSMKFASSDFSMGITNLFLSDCGGCIAYADSRDDGSDRTLTKWKKDLNDCRTSSPECNQE